METRLSFNPLPDPELVRYLFSMEYGVFTKIDPEAAGRRRTRYVRKNPEGLSNMEFSLARTYELWYIQIKPGRQPHQSETNLNQKTPET